MEYLIYPAFILLAALIIFLSIKLSKYVDLLDKTTNISGAFIGGVLLAAVTSLPELFTSISAVLFLHENELVPGNILGSNLFNFAALGIGIAIMFRGFSKAKVGKHHIISLIGCICAYALLAVVTFIPDTPMLGFVNLISPIIFVVYVVTIIATPKTEEPSEKTVSPIGKKQLIIRFVISAAVLVGASICITYVSDAIANAWQLGKTFAGALLLGLTTSLPEMVSTITLCRRGNFNASVGNILGSNIFNFCILFIADMLSFHKGNTQLYPYFASGAAGMQTMLLTVLGAAATLIAVCVLLIKTRAPQKRMLGHVSTVSGGTLLTAAYLLFLILSTTIAA